MNCKLIEIGMHIVFFQEGENFRTAVVHKYDIDTRGIKNVSMLNFQ
jgi:hypothetical protein